MPRNAKNNINMSIQLMSLWVKYFFNTKKECVGIINEFF